MKVYVTSERHTVENNVMELDRLMLVRLLNSAGYDVPEDAKVEFQVPGGGDYSNTEISVTGLTPVYVRWSKVIRG